MPRGDVQAGVELYRAELFKCLTTRGRAWTKDCLESLHLATTSSEGVPSTRSSPLRLGVGRILE